MLHRLRTDQPPDQRRTNPPPTSSMNHQIQPNQPPTKPTNRFLQRRLDHYSSMLQLLLHSSTLPTNLKRPKPPPCSTSPTMRPTDRPLDQDQCTPTNQPTNFRTTNQNSKSTNHFNFSTTKIPNRLNQRLTNPQRRLQRPPTTSTTNITTTTIKSTKPPNDQTTI